jgi:hypothetical protein
LSGLWSCLASPVNCVTSESLTGVGGSIISAVASWVTGDAHTWLTATGALMAQTTAPHVVTSYVQQEYVRVASVSPFIALLALLASVVHGMCRNDGASLVRHTATFLPLGIMITLVAPTLAKLVLRLADGLAAAVSGDVASQLSVASDQLATTAPTASMFAITALCLLAALALWVELILRNIVLALLLCTMPLVVAALVWSPARRVAGRVVEAFVAVALSKVAVVLALSLGLSGLASSEGASVVVGGATLALAAFAPYLVLRIVPFASHAAVHSFEGLRQRTVGTAATAGSHPVVQAVSQALPAKMPPLPATPDDLGLPMWQGVFEQPLPPINDGPRPPAPIIPPPVRTGRPVVLRDEMGPVMGWEWDDE